MRLGRAMGALALACSVSAALAIPQATSVAARSPLTTSAPTYIYASVGGAGLFRNTDMAGPWVGSTSLSTLSPSNVLALAIAGPRHWRTVFAGLSDGVYVSHDSGNTWAGPALQGHPIDALALDRKSDAIVLAGSDRGVYRSDDGGASWAATLGITRAVTAVAQAPQNAAYAYAGGANGLAWASRDGGRHWAAQRRGLPGTVAINALAVSPTDPTVVFAATSDGVWRAVGGSWTSLRRVPEKAFTGISADPAHVYAASTSDGALYVSTDGGDTWTRRAVSGVTGITALAQDALAPATLAVGGPNGTVRLSTDGGVTWTTPEGSVAGAVSSPILALAVGHRRQLPVDGVPAPSRPANPSSAPAARWFPCNGTCIGGHLVRGAILDYWQAYGDAAPSLLGYPLTEEFNDAMHGGARVQYFQHVLLLIQDGRVVPAPLGKDLLPPGAVPTPGAVVVDPHFLAFWGAHSTVLGPPLAPAAKQPTGDGTGRFYLVQYFRNARLEYHPEIPEGQVQVSPLGEVALQARGWL